MKVTVAVQGAIVRTGAGGFVAGEAVSRARFVARAQIIQRTAAFIAIQPVVPVCLLM